MTWPHVLAILLGGLSVIPVLYTLRMLARRDAESADAPSEPLPSMSAFSLREPEEEDVSPFDLPPSSRRTGTRVVFGRSDRLGERGDEGRPASRPAAFEYTIFPHHGSLRQDAPDLGGFTKVPFLLYDRGGNCVMVHRRLSLN